MFLWLLPLSVSSSFALVLNQTAHDSFPLQLRDEVTIDVLVYPVLFVLPSIIGCSMTVYKPVNGTSIVVGEIASHSSAFAVFFPSIGRIRVTATSPTAFQYYAIKISRPCPALLVSTSRSELFAADGNSTDANITITRGQAFCVFHVASTPTVVSVTYAIGQDALHFENSDGDLNLSGDGSFTAISDAYSAFAWTIHTANSLSIRFTAQDSTLPPRRGSYFADGRSSDPVVISDASGAAGELMLQCGLGLVQAPGRRDCSQFYRHKHRRILRVHADRPRRDVLRELAQNVPVGFEGRGARGDARGGGHRERAARQRPEPAGGAVGGQGDALRD
jgi:hypothetical protein